MEAGGEGAAQLHCTDVNEIKLTHAPLQSMGVCHELCTDPSARTTITMKLPGYLCTTDPGSSFVCVKPGLDPNVDTGRPDPSDLENKTKSHTTISLPREGKQEESK